MQLAIAIDVAMQPDQHYDRAAGILRVHKISGGSVNDIEG
jgi:hypothetical protein